MTDQEFWKRLKEALAIDDADRVHFIGEKVLEMLGCRLTYEEAEDLKAQLPSGLKQIWNRCESRPKWDRAELLSTIRAECGLDTMLDAENAVRAVFAALQQGITPGEADDVEAQLPKGVKELWESARAIPAGKQQEKDLKKVVY